MRVLPRKEEGQQGPSLLLPERWGVTLELAGPSALTQPTYHATPLPIGQQVFLYGMWAPQGAVSILRAETQWKGEGTGFGVILR